MQTIVIGHRNPDMDSVCSAIGYAHLKRETGLPGAVAGCAGQMNERILFALKRFDVPHPSLFTDVAPRVADVMEREVVTANAADPIYDAIHSIEERRLRGLPVIDQDGRCLGLLSSLQITRYLFPSRQVKDATRQVHASLSTILRAFGGTRVAGNFGDEEAIRTILVAAMDTESFANRLHRYDPSSVLLLVGDRDGVHRTAIRAGVGAIIVTSGACMEPATLEAAESAGIPVATSPHDTATTVLHTRGAVRCGRMVDEDFTPLKPEVRLDMARVRIAGSPGYVFPVLDNDGCLVGILSKSDFIKPIPRQLILVDHNELSQAVTGAESLPILEVLDHHRLGGLTSVAPMLFWNNPVGSTSTIVALAYRQAGVAIPPPIAGLLLCGLISDTLNLSSPTSTAIDFEVRDHLSGIAGEDPAKLAEAIFSVGSPLLTLSPEEAVNADCKAYEEKGNRFTVAQVEELGLANFNETHRDLLAALRSHRDANRLYFAALLITDIITQDSVLIIDGAQEFLDQIDYPLRGPNQWLLRGVVSRKKQLLPYLLGCLAKVGETPG